MHVQSFNRRKFLRTGTLVLAGSAIAAQGRLLQAAEDPAPALRVGLLTDIHYADRPPRGSRRYRESLGKVEQAVADFNDRRATIAIELGDFIDAAPDAKTELGYLKAIEAQYEKFSGERHYVLGNHCVDTLTKQEFLDNCGMTAAHYSFDAGGYHFIVLDACYNKDGTPYGRKNSSWADSNIPPAEMEWLSDDLQRHHRPTLVFVHQRLDATGSIAVKNAAEVRKTLEASGNVLAVFQGHHHVNDLNNINGIHYCTMISVVDGSGKQNNAYSLMDLYLDGTIRIEGFHKQKAYDWLPV